MVEMLRAGRTLKEIGRAFTVTREAARQILNRELGDEYRELLARNRVARVASAVAARAMRKRAGRTGRTCVVCLRPVAPDRSRQAKTCSANCSRLRDVAFYWLHPEAAGRRGVYNARAILRHPAAHEAVRVRHAERVLRGETKVRGRWLIAGSAVHAAVQEIERLRRNEHAEGKPN